MQNAVINGFKTGIRQWRVAAVVYCLQLCLALTLGMQVYEVLQASIGHSLEINKLMQQYDHTVLTDFLKVHGASITPLIGQLRWLLPAWLIFSVFIDAGLLCCAARPEQASGALFWQGGAVYFFTFLKISLLLLSLALLWTAVIWLPTLTFFQAAMEYFSSEKYMVWGLLFFTALWLAGLGVLFAWSVLSRLQCLQTSMSVANSLKNGGRVFWKNKTRVWVLLIAFAAVQLALMAVYFLLQSWSGMTSPILIVAFFILQQAFVFFRIQLRVMMYAGLSVV